MTAIEEDVPPSGGKNFNGEGAILVGNGTSTGNNSKTFLSNLRIGDKVGITMHVGLGSAIFSDKHLHVIGYQTLILENGRQKNTWNEAHPRTAVGFSASGKKVYILVVDGRQANYSAGSTTGQLGEILKALGATTGINFDGGGSSSITVKGKMENRPSDGLERAVANGIVVTTKK